MLALIPLTDKFHMRQTIISLANIKKKFNKGKILEINTVHNIFYIQRILLGFKS